MKYPVILGVMAMPLLAASVHAQAPVWPPWGVIPAPVAGTEPVRPGNENDVTKDISGSSGFRTVTRTWKFASVTGAPLPGIDVSESCDKCSSHVHSPGGPDKKEFSGSDADGNPKTAGQEFEKIDKQAEQYKRRHEPWHVAAKMEGDRHGTWFQGGSATETEMRHIWKEQFINGKWQKVANSDVWEQHALPAKGITVSLIIWKEKREEPCAQNVLFIPPGETGSELASALTDTILATESSLDISGLRDSGDFATAAVAFSSAKTPIVRMQPRSGGGSDIVVSDVINGKIRELGRLHLGVSDNRVTETTWAPAQ